MKKVIELVLVLAFLLTLTACSNQKGQDYLNARVLEIKENEIIAECIDEATNQLAGSTLSISTNVVSADGIPQMEIGQEIRVVFDFGKVDKQDDPVRIEHVYAIYLLDENGAVIANPRTEIGVAIATEASIPSELNTSQYIRQQWALDLQVLDVDRIDLVCNDSEQPFATFRGDALLPLVELINSINGEFVPEAIVSGSSEDYLLSTIYVFMNDDTRYTIQKIAGIECNYISIDNSIFMCTDELFDQFPDTGTGPKPTNHVIAGNRPIEIPNNQISRIQNIAPESDALPVPKGYETYDWMVNLKAEDVAYIEFVNLDENQYPYRRYQGDEIQEVIDLFQTNECYEYASEAQWHGFFSKEFHIIMKDGTAHTVCSIYSTKTVIDGAAYTTISDWLNNKWPEIGNEPLPENWDQIVASRNYHVAEDEMSVLSTSIYEAERRTLDHDYDTNLRMGSISRNYFIGRGVVELSALEATSRGLKLKADWSGSPGNIQLRIKTEYWLEQWHDENNDGPGEYVLLNSDCPISLPEQTIISQETIQWSVPWDSVLGSLEPGNYRIGMMFYEIVNGTEQNQTICYAKFSIK